MHSRRVSPVVPPLGLAALAIALGVGAGISPTGATASHPARNSPIALAARTMTLRLDAHLRLLGHPGHIITEQGSISGTLVGTAYGRFAAATATNGTGTMAFYPKGGGSINGRASTHGHVVGAKVYFSGTALVTGGSGRWAHASGTGLTFTGVMDRQNFHVTCHLLGRIHV